MRSERFATSSPIRLRVDVPAGRIQIEAAELRETEVELEPLFDDEGSREAVEKARIAFRGDELVVEVPEQRVFGISVGRRAAVALRVRCPEGSDARVRTRSAEVEGRGRFGAATVATTSGDVGWDAIDGDAELNTVSGDLRVGPIGGRLTLNTVSGDASIERVGGALRANAVSGDLTVREAAGPVKVDTISGDLELGSVEGGDVELNAVSGDLRVGIKRGSRLAVDATAVSGDLESEIELGDSAETGGDEGPVVDLRARTVSGDLRVVRA